MFFTDKPEFKRKKRDENEDAEIIEKLFTKV